jgi:hypothetical protein
MTTFRAYFSDTYCNENIIQVTGSATYTRFPSIPGYAFKLQGLSTNKGSFMIGSSSGTLAYEIDAGFETDWFPVHGNNLNVFFYQNVSGSNERLTVWSKG